MSDKSGSLPGRAVTRRQLLAMVGKAAGGAAMYQAMSAMGMATPSPYAGPLKLEGARRDQKILVLGAGMAGLSAAFELRNAGYQVKVLDYNSRAGGRSWTIRGGDEFTELGGRKQVCEFDKGLYINPGPWRIPHHHYGMLDYAKRLGVPLEPFMMVNYSTYLHSTTAFGGTPQRYGAVQADFHGHIAELLGKVVQQRRLDEALTKEDQERMLEALKAWGALDNQYRYVAGKQSAERRGWSVPPGGGLMPAPQPSEPVALNALVSSNLWRYLMVSQEYSFQTAIFQPVGGMDQIAMAVYREVKDLVQFNSKVVKIDQSETGVTVSYVPSHGDGPAQQEQADWCVCTIPLSILSQIDIKVQQPMQDAIRAVPYAAAIKVGLQFRRRFWEQDEQIYGGITFTDMPIQMISYPSTSYGSSGKGVLLGAYIFGTHAYEFTAMAPADRVKTAFEQGTRIHPQYREEFENGVAVGWHRVPWTNGCYGNWSEERRERHYRDLCAIDGRIVLAGEHASLIPAWQEGAVLSSHDAITRLHSKIIAGAAPAKASA
jgi:monoamine oxidase